MPKLNAANILTVSRIPLSFVLLFSPLFSVQFWAAYVAAGLTDMLDGTVARKTKTATEAGERLDTLADTVLTASCLIRILPAVRLPGWILAWCGAIAAVKVFSILAGYVRRGKLTADHSVLNKLTGLALFVFPFTLSCADVSLTASAVCLLATAAAVTECARVFRKA